ASRPNVLSPRSPSRRRELAAVAKRHGWRIAAVFADEGISNVTRRDRRPDFDALMMAVSRPEIDMVAAWSVDRLGRVPSTTLRGRFTAATLRTLHRYLEP